MIMIVALSLVLERGLEAQGARLDEEQRAAVGEPQDLAGRDVAPLRLAEQHLQELRGTALEELVLLQGLHPQMFIFI